MILSFSTSFKFLTNNFLSFSTVTFFPTQYESLIIFKILDVEKNICVPVENKSVI